MEYPKKIKLNSEKLKKLVTDKGLLITEGRATSEEIEKIEREMNELDEQIKQLEKSVDLQEFHDKEKAVNETVEKAIEQMKEIQKEIYAKLKQFIPEDLGNDYDRLKKKKERLEEKRNKIALNVQKYNDKIIPLGRKLMKPFLENEFEDYDTLRLEDGEVVCTIFSHLEDFKTRFKKNKK